MIRTTAQRKVERSPGAVYWLIARTENGRVEVLTFEGAGGKVLPVFSFEEEAATFLRLGGFGSGRQPRASVAGELISLLYGPCAGVEEVALDPLPEMMLDGTASLVSLGRGRFVKYLADTSRPRKLCKKSTRTAAGRGRRAG